MPRSILISALALAGFLLCQSPSIGQPAPDDLPKLTKSGFDKLKGGMTLTEAMALLGPRAEINPDPAPFGYAAPQVIVLWKERIDKWAAVVFVPDKKRVLRVFDFEKTGGTYGGTAGLEEKSAK